MSITETFLKMIESKYQGIGSQHGISSNTSNLKITHKQNRQYMLLTWKMGA